MLLSTANKETMMAPVRHQVKISVAYQGPKMAMAMAASLVIVVRSNDPRERHNTRSHNGHATGRLIQRVDKR